MTAGGPGGQNQNRSRTAIRCIHRPSAAVGVSRDERSQLTNKRRAFRRMAESKEFQKWLRIEIARRTGELAEIERKVDAMMSKENLRVEIF